MKATVRDFVKAVEAGRFDARLAALYGDSELGAQKGRCEKLLERMEECFGNVPPTLISVPGRTELGGNHTDHNHGRVLAAAVHLDCLACVSWATDNKVRIQSEGFSETILVDLNELSPQAEEAGKAAAIVRGVASSLEKQGYVVGGFKACLTSTLPMGVGLSSSAAFEMTICSIFNELYNSGMIPTLDMAQAARDAENIHFGKPCGFMDQIACAFQGVSQIDFANPDLPIITSVDSAFAGSGHTLVVVDTGGDHTGLTPEYAAITREMGMASKLLGQEYARGLTMDAVMGSLPWLREKAGDRAILRLIHFIEENERVPHMANALLAGDMGRYIELMLQSGDSSWRLLQNCASMTSDASQPIPLALVMSERLLAGRGAWRVHGGGFAGTIQALVPDDLLAHYRDGMEKVFGTGAVVELRIRRPGGGVLRID